MSVHNGIDLTGLQDNEVHKFDNQMEQLRQQRMREMIDKL